MSIVFHAATAAVLASLVAVTCRWRQFRPSICHVIWLVVLVKLVIPPVLYWPWTLEEVYSNVEHFGSLYLPELPAVNSKPHHGTSLRDTTRPEPESQPATGLPQIPVGWTRLLWIIWAVGALSVAVLHIWRFRRVHRSLRLAQSAPDWMQACAVELAVRMGVRPPKVLVIPGLSTVFVVSPWQPKILVSRELLAWVKREEWQGILAHELAHLKRRDLWVGWLELIAACVWWWHPVLPFIRRQLHHFAELACDAWVLWAVPGRGRGYAEVLYRILSLSQRQPSTVPVVGMTCGHAALVKTRLAMLLKGDTPCVLPKKALAAVCALLLVVLPSWTTATPPSSEAPPSAVYPRQIVTATTQDARAVLEMRLYLVRDTIAGINKAPNVPGFLQPGMALRALLVNPLDSKLSIDDVPLTMKGATLLWGGQTDPSHPRITQVASPVFVLRPEEEVSISMAVSRIAQKWLKAETPQELELVCTPDGDALRLRFALKSVPSGATISTEKDLDLNDLDLSEVWTNLIVKAPLDTWEGAVADISGSRRKLVGSLLMFWIRRPCEKVAPPVELPGPESGQYMISRHKREPYDPHDPQLHFRAEMKVTEAETTDIEHLVAGLEPFSGASKASTNIRMFRIPGKIQWDAIFDKMTTYENSELLSAPRATFYGRVPLKIVTRGSGGLNGGSLNKELQAFSDSLVNFLEAKRPQVLVADWANSAYRDESSGQTRTVRSGISFAISAKKMGDNDVVDLDLYYNLKELIRKRTGHLFWRREHSPNVLETPVEIQMSYHLDDRICFISKARTPDRLRLIFFVMERIAPTGTQFFESSQ
ncbi:MAG: M56 family metallopeptidase [Candidatus Hydrogenedentes bacterium]|nr:M56 family metallopeptidase [Candidatus Hydrogenedentota bacterium]